MLPPPHLLFLLVCIAFTIQPALCQLPTNKATSALTQHFLHPARGDVLVPGSIFTIKWQPNSHFRNITLQLWDKTPWGFSRDLLAPCHPWSRSPFCGSIAANAPNTGTYEWHIPNPLNGSLGFGFPRDEPSYWIKMYVEDYVHEEIGNKDPVVSYSQNFAFAKDGEPGTVVSDGPVPTAADGEPVTRCATASGVTTVTSTGSAWGTGSLGATPTSTMNRTAFAPLDGAASRVGWGFSSALLVFLGLL